MSHYTERRLNLADMLPGIPVLLLSGCDRYRNYPSYPFPFRASSHYMFFGGPNEPDNFLLVLNGDATLYRPVPHKDDEVWHGPRQTDAELKERFDLKEVKTHNDLPVDLATLGLDEVLSLPSPDSLTNQRLNSILGRVPDLNEDPDVDLVDAIMELRRCQDESAQQSIRNAVNATIELQRSVMAACCPGTTERELRGLLDNELASNGWSASFQPIISTAGEVLHNPYYRNTLAAEDLLLVDCGAEVSDGYVGDLTRTYPVDGKFSTTQQEIYDIVDQARDKAVSLVAPGVHFADLHKEASLVIAEGLVNLGILKGDPEELVEEGVHALFFCHGLGHLLGLDAHDMEDFGDRIGYQEGSKRSEQFGLSNLRLSRELEPGMVVTIEPGYYCVPALLDGDLGKSFEAYLNREVLERYRDVRGIRIEDVVLVTDDGHENLSSSLPTASEEIVKLIGTAKSAAV
jgi:Xaa-Pro aminopeptidase